MSSTARGHSADRAKYASMIGKAPRSSLTARERLVAVLESTNSALYY